ncbi:MAG: (d)CMP kinase [Alphaproteobacteria bacterium]|nr:(d)CMP kinase [Alphaproteobacteria bacterium]
MIITIDGPAAAGKGTLSQKLASEYGYAYFDTGMVYRAVGLKMLLSNTDLKDIKKAEKEAGELDFATMIELSKNPEFRSSKGGEAASVISSYPGVRERLLDMQKNFSMNPVFADGRPANGVIYDGRDTGTVVCPNAEVKFFITASPEVRAKRRYDEFIAKGMNAKFEDVLRDVKIRDDRDANRKDAPMKPADDAIILDTTNLNIEEVFNEAVKYIESKKK